MNKAGEIETKFNVLDDSILSLENTSRHLHDKLDVLEGIQEPKNPPVETQLRCFKDVYEESTHRINNIRDMINSATERISNLLF